MTRSYREQLAVQQLKGKAFGTAFPRYSVAASMVASLLGGLFLGTTLLLWIGSIEGLGEPALIQRLDSVWSIAAFAGGMMVVAAVSGWLFFGRLASNEIAAEQPVVRHPAFYLAATGGLAVLLVVVYVAVSFLNGLSELLALALVAFLLLYRVNSSNVWTTITGSTTSNAWITRLALFVPVVGFATAWLVGALPPLSAGEWSIVTLYALTVWLAMVGPLDALISQTDDPLEAMGVAIGVSEELAERQAAIDDRAPPFVDVDVWEGGNVSTLAEARSVLETVDSATQWLDAYDDYVETRVELEDQVADSVRERALAAEDDLETRVATIAENLRPDQYDDPADASEAATTLSRVVDRYRHDHLPAGFLRDDDLLRTAGPAGEQLSRIESRADEIPV